MKSHRIHSISWAIAVLAVSVFVTGSAQAAQIAGWDFSQWTGAGLPSTDNSTFQDTLDANYSSFDETFNAGAESAAFGTLYFDGSFGSTDVPEGTASQQFAPSAGSLASNLNEPVTQGGLNPFDSHTILADEGQTNQNFLGMTATDVVSVVFEADLSSLSLFATDWELTFGGLGAGSSIVVEYSTDGSSYANVGTVNLDANDTRYSVALDASASQKAYVRLNFTPTGDDVVIDNVSINANAQVPVFGSSLANLLFAALLGFTTLWTQRRRLS